MNEMDTDDSVKKYKQKAKQSRDGSTYRLLQPQQQKQQQ
jgi:hypothetical protein